MWLPIGPFIDPLTQAFYLLNIEIKIGFGWRHDLIGI
jgi:hypothetical protein